VHVLLPQPEEGAWQDTGVGGVGEAAVDKGHRQGADQPAKAQAAEACGRFVTAWCGSRGAVRMAAVSNVSSLMTLWQQ
jgi:hypothetical protein